MAGYYYTVSSTSIAQSVNKDYISTSQQDHEAEHRLHLMSRSRMAEFYLRTQ
jgi:hypothetical protein